MRTLVDLPETDLKQLNELSRARKTSRTQLIRLAVTGFLTQNRAGVEDSFGLWKDRGEDGVAYQERMRGEWER
jgi:metal-responsive CopG/Arc/MetJ family transcriptional regulator